jgi:hypothetical protein
MITANVYTKVRGEIAALFGWNVENLSPDQALRVDTATALRLALDHLQGGIVRGESIDITKMLTASEALARLLPPAVLAAPPAEQREDHGAAVAPLLKLFRYLHESVHTLSAENAHLKAALKAGAVPVPPEAFAGNAANGLPVPPDVPMADITPPSEWRGETYAGPVRPGPDDPPRSSRVTIEAKAVPKSPKQSAASAAPAKPVRAPDFDDTPGGQAWQKWHDAGGYGGPGFDRWSNRNIP